MKTALTVLALAGSISLAACQAGNPLDTSSGEEKAAALRMECDRALDSLYSQVEQSAQIVDLGRATVVFPNVSEASFVFGASTGNGCVYEGGVVTTYANKSGVSFGWQAGAQSRSEILVLTSEDAFNQFKGGAGLDFGANAEATVVSAGTGGAINVQQLMTNEILLFVIDPTGLLAAANIEGTKVTEVSFEG